MPDLLIFNNGGFCFCSALIKGVVCTKNIKHKRMTSQYKNPRILILGGSLEYQRASNQLASFDTLLQQVVFQLTRSLILGRLLTSFCLILKERTRSIVK